ncbi:hypothetical protein PHET_05410 [Paragonimus heterotremus]|uniref:ABC transporter domain-containing protein n=1 Tax=Paragonimus heterotremus TaxID=100268 RepID=A0A8J4TG87_9TREM|nr:hypothetical protein PHET_05410 [Paragonimus heterotremus]
MPKEIQTYIPFEEEELKVVHFADLKSPDLVNTARANSKVMDGWVPDFRSTVILNRMNSPDLPRHVKPRRESPHNFRMLSYPIRGSSEKTDFERRRTRTIANPLFTTPKSATLISSQPVVLQASHSAPFRENAFGSPRKILSQSAYPVRRSRSFNPMDLHTSCQTPPAPVAPALPPRAKRKVVIRSPSDSRLMHHCLPGFSDNGLGRPKQSISEFWRPFGNQNAAFEQTMISPLLVKDSPSETQKPISPFVNNIPNQLMTTESSQIQASSNGYAKQCPSHSSQTPIHSQMYPHNQPKGNNTVIERKFPLTKETHDAHSSHVIILPSRGVTGIHKLDHPKLVHGMDTPPFANSQQETAHVNELSAPQLFPNRSANKPIVLANASHQPTLSAPTLALQCNATTNRHCNAREPHVGAPDEQQLERWDGSLTWSQSINPKPEPVNHRSRHTPRTVYGPGQTDSQKNYSRLEALSSVVPLGSLSPFASRLRRESMSSSQGGPILVVDQPGYPTSGDSVISHPSVLNGSVLSFHHISYEVKLKKMPWSRAVTKTVLNDVSGILRPGLNAIMGPTGSGKSSLLDVLAGRKDPRFLSGQVLVDGLPQPKNFKCISGYVVQDDIVMGTLTVRENLNFSAALRMTDQCSKQERRRKVNEIIDELGLTGVADSKIGTDLIRGVSGGERKRTNIGMELITDPPVLFLDEPTTGLDAFMAGQVIKTLKKVHYPRSDKVCRPTPKRYLSKDSNNTNEGLDEPEHIHLVGERLLKEWDQSAECEKVRNEVSGIAARLEASETGGAGNGKNHGVPDISYAVPFIKQLNQVCWRTSVNLLRDPLASVVQTLVYLFFALSMGAVYFKMNTSLESGIQNRAGFFFFSTLQVVFVNLGSIELFIKERVLFIHENSSGYYRISAYFLSKIFCDILPTKVIPVLLFMPICYWMAGLVPQAGAFFFFELILSLTTLAAAAIALFISASFTLFGIANVIVSIVYVFMMVFGGYLINLKSMAAWLSWLRYFSIFRYSLGGLMITEMGPLIFCPTTNTSTPEQPDNRQW